MPVLCPLHRLPILAGKGDFCATCHRLGLRVVTCELDKVGRMIDTVRGCGHEVDYQLSHAVIAWKQTAEMQIGDVVVAVGNFRFACGSGIYEHAVVAHLDPLIVISPQGDMLWRSTITRECMRPLYRAHAEVIERVLIRLKQDYPDGVK